MIRKEEGGWIVSLVSRPQEGSGDIGVYLGCAV